MRTINGHRCIPRFFIKEKPLIAACLSRPANFAFTFLAQGASLKPSVVARAAINGVIACDIEDFQILSCTGAPLSWGAAARVVRQFQLAHSKYVKAGLRHFNKEVDRRCNAFAVKKAARQAAGRRAACKRILASLDADLPCSGKQRRAVLAAHRAMVAEAARKTAVFQKIRADKRAERARAAALYVPPPPPLPSFRTPYVCPLSPPKEEEETTREGRSQSRSSSPPRSRSSFAPARMVPGSEPFQAFTRTFNRVLCLPLSPVCRSFFSCSTGTCNTIAEIVMAHDLASTLLEWWELVPSAIYMNQLDNFLTVPTCVSLRAAITGLRSEIESLRAVSKDQTANGAFSWVASAGAAVGASIKEKIADTVVDTGKRIYNKVRPQLTDTLQWGESLFKTLKIKFLECLAPFLANVAHASEEIEKYWRFVHAWAIKMWTNVSLELQALGSAAWWAIAIIMVCGIVTLVEKLLVHLGVLTCGGVLCALMLTMVLGAAGLLATGKFSDASATLIGSMRALVFSLFGSWKSGLSNAGDIDCNANVLDFPLKVLETVGTGLISAPLGTLQYIGKYGQAMDQIRKGKDALKEFVGFCMDRIADAWDYMTGRKDSFLREIASATKVDIVHWIKSTQSVLLQSQTIAVTDVVLLDTVTHLLHKGQILQLTLAQASRTTSLDYGRIVGTLVRELNEIRARCARAGKFEGRRPEPFWCYMFGKSHCGKSLFMEDVSRALLKEYGHAPNDIYAKNARDSYWSGYLQHACVQVDDLSACVTDPSLESEFLQLIGSKNYCLNMAAVEDKGMSFNSSIVVTTANCFTAPTDARILDKDAYGNRRNVVVQCRAAPGVAFDPTNPTASCEARLVNVLDGSPLPGETWRNCSAVLDAILTYAVAHRNKENLLMANYRTRSETQHPIYTGAKSFIHKLAEDECFVDIMCDDVYYKHNHVSGKTELQKGNVPFGYEDLCIAKVLSWNERVGRDMDLGLLYAFVHAFTEGPCHVDSVHSLNGEATSSQREFFSSLSLLERIYMRLVQKKLDQVKANPDFLFSVDIKSRLLKSLRSGYNEMVTHGGTILAIFAAMLLVLLLYSSFFALYQTFVSGAGGAVAAVGMMTQLNANAGSVSSSMSSTGSVSSYASSNIPIHHRNVNAYNRGPYGLNSNDDDQYLMKLLAWLQIPGQQLISCIRFKGRSLLLTQHQALAIPEGARIHCCYLGKNNISQSIPLIWSATKMQTFADTEAVLFTDPSLSPMPSAQFNHFNVDVARLPKTFDMNGVVVKQKQYMLDVREDLAAAGPTQPVVNLWSSTARMNTERQGISTHAYGGSYRNELPRSIMSTCPTSSEDCGAIMTTIFEGRRVVVGMHVASGKNPQGRFISTACLLPAYHEDLDCNSGLQYVPEPGTETAGYRKLGYIGDVRKCPHYSATTAFVAVPPLYAYTPPPMTETLPGLAEPVEVKFEIKQPAILSKDDKRIAAGVTYDPFKDGMKKFAAPMGMLDEGVCSEIAQDMCETWFECFSELEDVSDEVAINGSLEMSFEPFNLHTSEGYPEVLNRKSGESGKTRFFSVDPETGVKALLPNTGPSVRYDALHSTCYTSIPEMVCIETPKDECLPLRKITGEKPKTRLFSILPLEFNLFLRKKFLSFAASMQRHRDTLPTQVGIDPYSREWGSLLDRLQAQNSVAVNCDYASFDGLLTAQILSHIGHMINRTYKGTPESKQQRYNLLMSIINRRSICGSQVYEVNAGIPSGCALTVVLNSIFNEFLIRYVWRTTIVGIPRERFSQYVTLLIYGDDNLIAIHPDFLPSFNGEVIRKRLAEVAVTITDGSDKTAVGIYEKPLGQLDFLKRRFKRQDNGTVSAPLDLASIFTCLQNVTLGAGSIPLAVQQNVHVALTELYLHGRQDWYDHLRNHYIAKHGWSHLPTWRESFVFHQGHMTGTTPWAPHRIFDVPVEGEKLKLAMSNQGGSNFSTHLGKNVYVCGRNWKVNDPENQFVVSMMPLQPGEENCGVKRLVEFPSNGVGRLPTQDWVAKFRQPRNSTTALIRAAHSQGKAIYFRAENPYISNWLAAISFAQGVNADYESMIGLYHNVCTPGTEAIYSYFDKRSRRPLEPLYIPPGARART
ncbi:TPA_asm: polyprotein [Paris polyphylla secovirus 1]|uniref:RNA1 polyprotein n=1 Tax=Paris polyphylla secovirus 1 TaxID=2936690 RepID=A0A9N6YJA8_9SECO|nr:TPA_asm: polyprotein [Paris polyphylla secovirus 1]